VDSAEERALEDKPRERRRRRTVDEKRLMVEATLAPGSSITRVAREHGVNANQLFHWRKLYQQRCLEI
jgi:transposase